MFANMTDFDFMLTEEQIGLRDLVREFAQNEVKPTCRILERDGIVPEDLVKTANGMGLNLVSLPTEYGGLGLDKFTYAPFGSSWPRATPPLPPGCSDLAGRP